LEKKKAIQQYHDKKYLQEYKDFKQRSHDRDAAKIRLSELEEQLERLTVLEFVLTTYNDAKRKIAIKIREAVKSYSAVKQRLSNTAILKLTKTEISNPLELNHLGGLLQLLSDNYNKKTLVTLTNSLIEVLNHALSEEETRFNPVKAVNDAEKMHSIWDKKHLWDHLTPDTFFTSMLIRSLHPRVAIRQEVLNEVTKLARSLEDQESTGTVPLSLRSGRMPLFRHACDFIKNSQENRKMMSNHSSTKPTGGYGAGASGGNTGKIWSNKSNVESAATAQDHTANSANHPQSLQGEILKARNITVKDKKFNRTHIYLATVKQSTICAKCYPDSGSVTDPCEKKCFAFQCDRCKYFGHRTGLCLHSHRVDGSKIE